MPVKKSKVKTRHGKKPTLEWVDSTSNTNSNEENPAGETSEKEAEPWNVVLSKKSRKEQQKKGFTGIPNIAARLK